MNDINGLVGALTGLLMFLYGAVGISDDIKVLINKNKPQTGIYQLKN
jgi:hypothetical protein